MSELLGHLLGRIYPKEARFSVFGWRGGGGAVTYA